VVRNRRWAGLQYDIVRGEFCENVHLDQNIKPRETYEQTA
jgi:hypothetical protein